MLATLDVVRHHENSISIMDMEKDLDISDAKWNFVFEHLLNDTTTVYFKGYRLWLKRDEALFDLIDFLSEEFLFNKKNYLVILFRVKPNAVYINRAMLQTMWEYYEFPELVFVKAQTEEEEQRLITICDGFPLKKDSTNSVNGVYRIRREGAPDVLWLEKSNDMTFPWQTTRSPIAIEQEANRSWYERLLNKMGFFWTIRINRK